jgi:hypothetical protein
MNPKAKMTKTCESITDETLILLNYNKSARKSRLYYDKKKSKKIKEYKRICLRYYIRQLQKALNKLYWRLVIDRKQIFLFRPKTNIQQENTAEYSADNKYSAQGRKYQKNVNLYMKIQFFSKVAVASCSCMINAQRKQTHKKINNVN